MCVWGGRGLFIFSVSRSDPFCNIMEKKHLIPRVYFTMAQKQEKKQNPSHLSLSLSLSPIVSTLSLSPYYSMPEFKKALRSSGDPSSTPSMAPTVFVTKTPRTSAATTTPAAEAGERLRAATTGLAAVAAVPRRTEK